MLEDSLGNSTDFAGDLIVEDDALAAENEAEEPVTDETEPT